MPNYQQEIPRLIVNLSSGIKSQKTTQSLQTINSVQFLSKLSETFVVTSQTGPPSFVPIGVC